MTYLERSKRLKVGRKRLIYCSLIERIIKTLHKRILFLLWFTNSTIMNRLRVSSQVTRGNLKLIIKVQAKSSITLNLIAIKKNRIKKVLIIARKSWIQIQIMRNLHRLRREEKVFLIRSQKSNREKQFYQIRNQN